MKESRNWKSSKYIGIMSLCIFVAVAIGMISSTYYVNVAIREEENAESRRGEYRQLGEYLARASDYLTSEVRYFAVTGDIGHLYNYWYEIYETKQRDYAIDVFESSNPPIEEQSLLETAKEYSDLLVKTETLSMKMALLSMGKTAKDYSEDEKTASWVSYVLSSPMPAEYETLDFLQLSQKSISLLYDDNYEAYKEKIMAPIDEFQKLMNRRLDQEVEEKKEKTRREAMIQTVIALVTLAAIAFLIYIMNQLYIRPLKNYTREISDPGFTHADQAETPHGNDQILDAKIIPFGAAELVQLAIVYNHRIDLFFTELHHRKTAEESMKKAKNEAELANEAKSIFLAQMSHELRTPLNAVNGYTHLLERTSLNTRQYEYVENIRKSSKGLLELINQVLDFSKIDMGHLVLEEVAFSLKEVAEEVWRILSAQARAKGLYLRLKLDEEIPDRLLGDPLRMRQVLMNLVGNAIKFTEYGGVELRAGLCAPAADHHCCVFFEIEDTGVGISEEAKEKIFQPFTQSDASITRKYGGTGLGLPISSQIVELSGDKTHRLKVESEPGKGSVFSFEMDYQVVEQEEAENGQKTNKLPDCGGKRLLLIDDNEVNLQVLGEMLTLTGAEVIMAQSGKQALQILTNRKDVHLIFMDIRMPEMDGYETARRLRAMEGCGEIPVIALTADATKEVKRKTLTAGMNDCLLKPVQPELLFETLENYLGAGDEKDEYDIEETIEETIEAAPTEVLFREETLRNHLGGNEASFLQMIHTFLTLHQEDDEKLMDLLKQEKWKDAKELLHLLKGVAGNLCCFPLAEACDCFRREIKEAHKKDYDEKEGFLKTWKSTVREMEEAYRRRKEIQDAACREEKKKGFSGEQLEQFVVRLLSLCEDHDTEAVAQFENNQEQLEQHLDKDSMYSIRKSSMRYDFNGMKASLRNLREGWEVK